MKAIQVDYKYYHTVLDQLPQNLRAFLDDKITADKYYLVFIEGNPVSGFCTNKDGYMGGLFSLLKGTGNRLIDLRIATAAADRAEDVTSFEVFCIGEKMRAKYMNRGFTTDLTAKWNDGLATTNWDYEKFGKPNVYTLRRRIK